MSYSKVRWNAANCLASTTGGKLRENARNLKAFYQAVAEHGAYGYGQGWAWSSAPSEGRRLADQLVAKGLLVDVSEGRKIRYVLAPDRQAEFDALVVGFERLEREERAKEQAATQAAFEAKQALEAAAKVNRRHVVVLVNRYDGTSKTVGEIYTGSNSDVHARNQARFWADGEDAEQFEAIVVRLADAQPTFALPA